MDICNSSCSKLYWHTMIDLVHKFNIVLCQYLQSRVHNILFHVQWIFDLAESYVRNLYTKEQIVHTIERNFKIMCN